MQSAIQPLGTITRRYLVQRQLGQGGMGVVYAATDRLNLRPVALKKAEPFAVVSGSQAPTMNTAEFRVLLAHEFKVLASLRHPNIISVLDYGFDDDQNPYFTMELLEGAQSLSDAAEERPLDYKLDLLAQLLQALNYLHRHGILHRDLKPQNVLVVDDRVKVLDFGIASLRQKDTTPEENLVSGTLPYIAPEVLMGNAPSAAADLYAVGVMAYELLTGRHPFDLTDTTRLINDILFTPPQLPTGDIPDPLVTIINRLLEKYPDNRYATAAEVLAELSEATGRSYDIETAEIRASFLEAAAFAGREREMNLLLERLQATLSGQGSALLLAGESGVGKSRLLDEMRIHALVSGVQVLRGQAISEGGNPFQVWRDVLYRLCVLFEIRDTEGSILLPVVPRLTDVLHDDLPEMPALDAGAAQDRLFNTIEKIFTRQTVPMLVILEDLQWADNESLLLLARLAKSATDRKILFIGSFRDDERPHLARSLPDIEVLRLGRLDAKGTEAVIVSMLGERARQAELIALLQRETEGNLFFLVEVVRVLAEEAGQLDQIRYMLLPQQVSAGGVTAIINRRLSKVPDYGRALLRLAAVAGRVLDLAVLQAAEPEADLDDWLAACADAAVLTVQEDHYRFSHDKLRERLLEELADADRRAAHRRVAVAIEQIYPDGVGQFAALAQHWEWAQVSDKAAHYYRLAGQQAEAAYTPIKAIEYYRKALAFLPGDGGPTPAQVEIYHGLGRMLRWQTQFDDAVGVFQKMVAAAEALGDNVGLARAWIGMGDVRISLGERQEALASAEKAADIAHQAGSAANPERVEALGNKAWAHYRLSQYTEAEAAARETLNLSIQLNQRGATGRSLNTLGIVAFLTGRYDAAEEFMGRAVAIARELDDKRDVAIKLNNLGEMRRLRGDPAGAIGYYQESLAGFREIGYRENELALLNNLGALYNDLRDYAAAEAHLQQILDLTGGQEWFGLPETYLHLAGAYLGRSMFAAAQMAIELSLLESQKNDERTSSARAWRMLGRVAARLGMPLEYNSETFSAAACFERSLTFCGDQDPERAHTLWTWAGHEMINGDGERGQALWNQARELFLALGMPAEAEQMAQLPPL